MSKITLKWTDASREKSPPKDIEVKEVQKIPPEATVEKEVIIPQPRLLPQVVAAILGCWINLATGACLGYATPALPKLQRASSYVQLSESEASWMASLLMLGALAGGALAGPCIAMGRRRALWLAAAPVAGSWAAVAAATNTWCLFAAHAVMGVCLGVTADASQLYVSETAHAARRGALGCVPILMFNVGILACYAAGAWLDWDELGLFGCALSLPALVLPALLPESPSYLVGMGRAKETLAALKWLRGPAYDVSAEFEELSRCEAGPGLRERLQSLRERSVLRPLLLTCAVRALSRLCGLRAIQCYAQAIFVGAQSSLDAELSVVATGAVQLLATLLACGLLDRLGRRRLLIASQAVMGVCLIGLGCYLYYTNDVNNNESLIGWVPVVTILTYIIANSIGLGPVSGIVIGELVPQRHRSIVSSITGSVSWLSAFIITKTFLDLRSCLQLHGAIWAYGSVCIVGVVFVYCFIPETRGLSQYEIEVLFEHKSSDEETRVNHIEALSDVVVVQLEGNVVPYKLKNASNVDIGLDK